MNAVITYIFGAGQEVLRDPLIIDPNTEYICVTDQKQLKSTKWKIIYDTIPEATCTRDKMPAVKYNPFKYTRANKIIVLDGTMQIKASVSSVFSELDNYDILVKRHPDRTNLLQELDAWITIRHMPSIIKDKLQVMSSVDSIDLSQPFLVESCIVGYRSTSSVIKLTQLVIKYMEMLGEDGKLCPTNQIPFTYLLRKFNVPVGWIQQKNICNRYKHNSWIEVNK